MVAVGQPGIGAVDHHLVVGGEAVVVMVVFARIEQAESAPAQFEAVDQAVGVAKGVGLAAAVVLGTDHEIRGRQA